MAVDPGVFPLRTRINNAFHDLVKNLEFPTGLPSWVKTSNNPILRILPQECPAFYSFDFQEKVIQESEQKNEVVRPRVYIILEFWVQHSIDEDSSQLLNAYLWRIQKALAGSTLGLPQVQKVSEVGSKFKVESAEDRIVSAEVAYQVTYVRKYNDQP